MFLKTVTNSFLRQILSFIYCLLQRQQPRFRAPAVLFLLFIFSEKRPDLGQIVPDWRKQYLLSVVTLYKKVRGFPVQPFFPVYLSFYLSLFICSLFHWTALPLDQSRSIKSFISLLLEFFKDFFPILKGKYRKILVWKFVQESTVACPFL
jgi:hypothetical protein